MPRKGNRLYKRTNQYFRLPGANPEQSALYFDGLHEIAMTRAAAREMESLELARKEGRVEIRSQFGPCSVLLFLKCGISGRSYQLEIMTTRSSNLSLRMSPPVPTRKEVFSGNSRRHKIKTYTNISNSPYMRWLDSGLENGNHVCRDGGSKHKDDKSYQNPFYQEDATSCRACIVDQWLDGNRQLPLEPQSRPVQPPWNISSCRWFGIPRLNDAVVSIQSKEDPDVALSSAVVAEPQNPSAVRPESRIGRK